MVVSESSSVRSSPTLEVEAPAHASVEGAPITETSLEIEFQEDETSSQPLGNETTSKSSGTENHHLHPALRSSWSWTVRCLCCHWISSPVKDEIKALLHLSWPIVLTVFLQVFLTQVNVLFCGHIGKAELDAAGLAISFTNVTGLSIGIGFATACDTLLSQAYGGKNLVRVGITLQKGILILGLLLFPTYAIWLNTESIMLLLQQDPEVARLSGLFAKVLMIGLPGNFLYTLLTKYLQNQGVVKPLIFVGGFVLVCSVLAHYLAVFVLNLGLVGAAFALAFSQLLQPVICLAVIRYKKLATETWHGWSWKSLSQWGLFLRLALPGTVMVCVEWWSFEIIFFVSGAISDVDLAANIVFFQILTSLFMIPLGISIAVSIRVGTYLGANKPSHAKRAAWVAVKLIVVWSIIVALLLVALRSNVGYIYTSDSDVIKLVGKTMPLVALLTVFDYVQAIIQGIFRGSGRQKTGAGVNAMGFYLIGLPLGISLALWADMRVFGLWLGMCSGVIALTILGFILTLKFDWQYEAKKARVRAGVSHLPADMTDSLDDTDNTDNQMISLEVIKGNDQVEKTESEDSKLLLKETQFTDSPTPSEAEVDGVDIDSETAALHIAEPSMSLSEKRRVLLNRLVILFIGILLVVASGFASQYRPHLDDKQALYRVNGTDLTTGMTSLTTNSSDILSDLLTTITALPRETASMGTQPCPVSSSTTLSLVKLNDLHKTGSVMPSPSPVIPRLDTTLTSQPAVTRSRA